MAGDNKLTLQVLADAKQALATLETLVTKLGAVSKAAAAIGAKTVTFNADAAIKEIQRLDTELGKLQKRTAKGAGVEIKLDTKAITQGVKVVENEIAKAERAVQRGLRAIEAEAKRNIFGGLSDSAKREGEKLTKEFNQLTAKVERAFAAIQTAQRRGGFDPTSESARKLRENLRLAGEDMLAFGSKLQKGAAAGTPGLTQLNAELAKTKNAIQGLRKEEPVGPSFISSLTSATGAIRAFLAVMAVRPILDFANGAREAATALDQMERRLSTLTGSIPSAREELDSLREFSDRFGLSFEKTAKGFTQFAISAESLGLPLSEARDIFQAVSIAASGAGASAEDLEGIFRALTQMLSKGTVQAEELRGQLGDRLPGAFAAMARAIGVTTQELDKMLKAGAVGSRETLPKFAAELLKTFGPAAAANISSAASQMARFDNAVLKAKQTVGAEMLPAINELLEALVGIGEDGESGFKRLGKAMSDVLGRVGNLVRAMRDLSDGNVKAGIQELGAAILKTFAGSSDAVRELLKTVTALNPALNFFFQKSEEGFKKQKQAVLDEAKALEESARKIREGGVAREDVAKAAADQSDRLRDRLLDNEGKVTALTQKELDKREKSYKKLYESIAKLAQSARPDTPSVEAGEAPSIVNSQDGARLDELKAKLESLRAEKERLSESPLISAEDGNRLSEISSEMARLEQEMRNVPPAAEAISASMSEVELTSIALGANFKEFGKQVSEVLVELVTDNEEFAESFKALSPASKAAVEQLINDLQSYASAGVATEDTLRNFGIALTQILSEGGQLSSDFAAKMKAAFSGTASAAELLKGGFDSLGGSQRDAVGAAVEYDAATNTVRSTLDKATDAALRYDEATKTLTNAQGDVVASTDSTAESLKAATPPAEQFGNVVGEASSKVDETKAAVDAFSASLAEIPREIQAIIDVAPALAPVLSEIGAALSENAGPVGEVGALYLELAGHLRLIAEDGPAAVEAINAIAASGEEQGEGLASLVESFTNLVAVVTPVAEALDKAKLAIEAIQTAAEEMPEVIDALSEAFAGLDVEPFIEAAGEAQEAVTGARTEVEGVASETDRWAQALEAVRSSLDPVSQTVGELQESAGSLAEALASGVNPALRETAEQFRQMVQTIPPLSTFFKNLIENGPEGIRDVAAAVRELAQALRDDLAPAASAAGEAMSTIQLPQGA